ncbi:MAG: helix-turn-helix domain-containing protein [Acidimicrobiia bacterium]
MSGSPPSPPADPADTFLDVEDIAARYGISRTKAYELVAEPGFPASVVTGLWRVPLGALRRFELHRSLAATDVPGADTPAQPAGPAAVGPIPSLPPARRPGRPRKGTR